LSDVIHVAVADDHPMFRAGVVMSLREEEDIEIVGEASDASTALALARAELPQVMILDINMPGGGLEAARSIAAACPATRIVMLTVSEDEADLAAALRAGACGYLLKTIEGDALVAAMHRAMRGASVVAEEMTGKLVAAYRDAATLPSSGEPAAPAAPSAIEQLSPRERDILRGIARGASNKEIARDLGIAETTVKIHVQHVLRKLDVSSRVQAAVAATEHGLT